LQLCEYGCGREAQYQFKNGKWCCSKHHLSCLINKQKIKNYQTGRVLSKEHRQSISKSHQGKKLSQNHRNAIQKSTTKRSLYNELNIKDIQEKYPTFVKVEEMRYNSNNKNKLEIQVHCKNNKCKNSKEKGGWFTPNRGDLFSRIYAIEKPGGFGGSYLYCSNICKKECVLYDKKISTLIYEDQINSGQIKEPLYTSEEYKIWRDEVFKRADNKCEYCGIKASHAHHSRPQKLEPGFVLDPDFGVACCEKHHYEYGHKDECNTGKLANKICI